MSTGRLSGGDRRPRPTASHSTARLLLILAALGWSTSGVILKSLPSVHWLAIAGLRSAFGALIFLPGVRGPHPPRGKLLAAVGLYALLYAFEDSLLALTAQGGWLFVVPVAIAFVISFVHGGFTAHFWDLLGIKAKK